MVKPLLIFLIVFSNFFLKALDISAFPAPALFQTKVIGPADTSKSKTPMFVSDTSKNDTIAIVKTDTIKYSLPIQKHGSMFLLPYYGYKSIAKEEIQYDNYLSLYDILRVRIPAYPLSLGAYGQFNSLSVFGGRPRDINLKFDGRNLFDADYGSINPEQYPPDFMERAEVMTGSDAVILSDNSSGALINIIEPRYNTKSPYTRIWYAQAANGFIGADGIFSHNFAPNWNFDFGFRRVAANGSTTILGTDNNSGVDSWNIRGLLRWSPSDRTTLSLSELFTNHYLGDFGGVDTALPFVWYPYLNERVFRHDLTFAFTSYLSEDTTSAITGTLYFTNAIWNMDRPREFVPDTLIPTFIKHLDRQSGATIHYEQALTKFIILRTGGEFSYLSVEGSAYNESLKGLYFAGFGHAEIKMFSWGLLSGGARFSSIQDHQLLSFGGRALFNLDTVYSLALDASRSQRMPTPAEGLSLKDEENYLFIAEAGMKLGSTSFALSAYTRKTNSPITAVGIYDSTGRIINTRSVNGLSEITLGGDLSASFKFFDHLYTSARIQTNISSVDGTNTKRFPLFLGTIRSYYEVLRGRSMAAFGFSFTVISNYKGERYIPMTRSYVPIADESRWANNGLDIFIFGRLGSAFIKATYENILSQYYFYVPGYPQLDRNIRLSVGWSFLD